MISVDDLGDPTSPCGGPEGAGKEEANEIYETFNLPNNHNTFIPHIQQVHA